MDREIGTGAPIVEDHRWPQPGSRPEKFTVPSSKASDIAQNPYYLRDFRRMYPSTAILTQPELTTLLIEQGGFTSYVFTPLSSTFPISVSAISSSTDSLFDRLPAPASGPTGSTALTTGESAPTLSSLYLTPTTDAALPAFKAPRPPGMKFSWAVAKEEIPHDKDAYFPMWFVLSPVCRDEDLADFDCRSASSKRIA